MAFKAIEVPTLAGNGELPWLSHFVEANPEVNGMMFQVQVVAFSQKGVMVTTEHFKAFLYRSNPYYDFLFEAVTTWTTNNIPVCALVLLVDKSQKSKFQLGIEDSLESHWVKKSETLFKLKSNLPDFLPTAKGSNPLLALSSNTATQRRGRGRKGEAGKGGEDKVSKAAASLAKASGGAVVIEESFDEAWDVLEPPSDESGD